MATVVELPIETYAGPVDPDWCPGCGDFGVLKAVKLAAAKAGVVPKDLVVVSGIGCSSNLPHFLSTYGFGLSEARWYTTGDPIHFNDEGSERMATEMARLLVGSIRTTAGQRDRTAPLAGCPATR